MDLEYCPCCMSPVKPGEPCEICKLPTGSYTPAEHQLPPGTVLRGRYLVDRVLGEGTTTITYIGRDPVLGRKVAVKEYFTGCCARRGADGVTMESLSGHDNDYNCGRISFLKEARGLTSLKGSHPAIAACLDCFEAHNTAYLVMEYLNGTPLHQVVRERKRLAPEELLPKMDRLMDGVSWLHGKWVLHRDIGPDSIMWMDDGTLKLMRFESNHIAEAISLKALIKDGFAPMEKYSPSGVRPLGPWSDVYALAAVICYCLTGHRPEISVERFLSKVTDGVDPLRLPDSLNSRQYAALTHALAIYPKERTQTMAQFRQELFLPPPPGPYQAIERTHDPAI